MRCCLAGMGLIFISIPFFIGMQATTRPEIEREVTSPRSPIMAFGETPFDMVYCLQDSAFKEGKTFWNFTSSTRISANNDSITQQGNISSYSASVVGKQNLAPTYAEYRDTEETTNLRNYDSQVVSLTYPLLGSRANLNVVFPEFLSNGCIITMRFTSGNSASITIYDFDSTSPAAGYGSATYGGGVQTVNIALNGLSEAKNQFNLYVAVPYLSTIDLDQVVGYIPPTQFQESANIKQPFTIPRGDNLSYSLNFTYTVTQFQSINQALFRAQINGTELWRANITGTSAQLSITIPVPRALFQSGGNHGVIFNFSLNVNTFEEVKFRLFLDDAFLLQTPALDLLDDSECVSGAPWDTSRSALNYSISHEDVTQLFICMTNTTGRSRPDFADGWVSLQQVFQKNLTQGNFQLNLDIKTTNLTGVDHANITVQLNNTLIGVEEIRGVRSSWQRLSWNASSVLQVNGSYILNITFRIKLLDPHLVVGWACLLDNIFLYPLWNSTLTQVGEPFDGNINAGEQAACWFCYNMTDRSNLINDAEFIVFNKNTANEWGLDFSPSRKYLVTNYQNGTYAVNIISQGVDIGLYNLTVVFIRPNFPDTSYFLTLNVSGSLLSMQFTSGVHFNATHDMWFVDDENTPYVNDSSSKITLLLTDTLTTAPLANGFVEAWLGTNNFFWEERYKQTQNSADVGYYDIYINSTRLDPVSDYLVYNFTIRASAQGYTANMSSLSTRINFLPSSLLVPFIDPFYEGSSPELTATFQDTYNHYGIDDAVLTWSIEGTAYTGQFQFQFYGYYKGSLSAIGLPAGIYNLQVTGQKDGYVFGFFEREFQVLAKWNVSIVVTMPPELVEGNHYSISCNMTCNETGEPLVGEQVTINVQCGGTSINENYLLFTGSNGLLSLDVDVPTAATCMNLTLAYAGRTNVSSMTHFVSTSVRQKFGVNLTLLTTELPFILIGGINLELHVRLMYSNGTGIAGQSITFSIGNSVATAITDVMGHAIAIIKLPSDGAYTINITYAGTATIRSYSLTSPAFTVTSPGIAIIIIITIGLITLITGYLALDRGLVKPRKRKRAARLKELTSRFEDAQNNLMLMVIGAESGVEVYSTSFSAIPMDSTLVSGLLTAITSFGQELLSEDAVKKLKGPKAKSVIKRSLQEINYQHFKIILQEIEALRVALIVLRTPSPRGLENFQEFTRQVDNRFGPTMPTRGGRQIEDEEIWDLVENFFEPSLTYVHFLDQQKDLSSSLSRLEKVVVGTLIEHSFYGSAYLNKLQDELVTLYPNKDVETLEKIFALRQKQILLPIPQKFMEFYSKADPTLQNLLDVQKQVLLQVGSGEHDPTKLQTLSTLDQNQFTSIVQPLKNIGILTQDYDLNLPGKILLLLLKYKYK